MAQTPSVSGQNLHERTFAKSRTDEAPTPEETYRLLHELQLLHVELSTENEALRHTQNMLEASCARYAALYDLAPVGCLVLSSRGAILEVNRAAAAMLGVEKHVLLDKEVSEFVFHEDRHVYYQQRRKVFGVCEMQVWEMRMLQADGSPLWTRLQATPAQNGEYWIAMFDITERKQAEEKLRQWMWRAMPSVPEAVETGGPVC